MMTIWSAALLFANSPAMAEWEWFPKNNNKDGISILQFKSKSGLFDESPINKPKSSLEEFQEQLIRSAANKAKAEFNQGEAAYQQKDYVNAFQIFSKLANEYHEYSAYAQNYLGYMYLNSQGVAQDYNQAMTWFQKAANKGNPSAQNNLGWMYLNSKGVAQDYNQAMTWLQKAANQGNPNAQNSLGWMYFYGKGVPQDYHQSRFWYQKAANQGHTNSKTVLQQLDKMGK